MNDTADRLRKIAAELGERFYERGDVVRTLITTVLAGQPRSCWARPVPRSPSWRAS
ncbi:hypothetical protein [Prauserella muralis]|uniref:hypothetical protein n=1 Tax=Prauserella muralis TaxID=588067 RepID=UPI001BAC79C9|nr:hypothetical protein [Prauserella muralis]